MVMALVAIRRHTADLLTPSWLEVATARLVVPSLIPRPHSMLALNLVSVLPTVQRISAFGVSPSPCAIACVTGAALVLLVKLPTLMAFACAVRGPASRQAAANAAAVLLLIPVGRQHSRRAPA